MIAHSILVEVLLIVEELIINRIVVCSHLVGIGELRISPLAVLGFPARL